MSEKTTTDATYEAMKRDRERHLQKVAILEQEMTEYAQLMELAAKFKRDLVPTGGQPVRLETISDLIAIYKNSPLSAYQNLKFASKRHYETILGIIDSDRGPAALSAITEDDLKEWYRAWGEGGRIASSNSKIGMVRGICGFGIEVLKDGACGRVYAILSKMKFEVPKARTEHLTEDEANRIRAEAHRRGRHSIALAQALIFETPLIQKDVIGEWVPMSEKDVGFSDILRGDKLKWVRGIRWETIDANLVLSHSPYPGEKPIKIDLKTFPMVVEELARIRKERGGSLPPKGAVILAERLKLPWNGVEFRRHWRILADACKISKDVRSSDKRGDGDPQEAEAEEDARIVK